MSILAVIVAVAAVGFGALLGGKSNSGATAQSPASTQSPASKKKLSSVPKWIADNSSKIEALTKSMQAAQATDVASPGTSMQRSDCQQMGDASRAVANALPTPNPALTNALRGATDAFDRAAQQCIAGVDRKDPAALDQFRTEFGAGQKQMDLMTYIVGRFNKGG